MSEHTPGPWNLASPKEGGCLDQKEDRLICTTINNHLYHIAETFQYRNTEFNTPDGVSLANARLIAAAPDLLAACKELLENYERDVKATKITGSPNVQYALDIAKAAIEKAKPQ